MAIVAFRHVPQPEVHSRYSTEGLLPFDALRARIETVWSGFTQLSTFGALWVISKVAGSMPESFANGWTMTITSVATEN